MGTSVSLKNRFAGQLNRFSLSLCVCVCVCADEGVWLHCVGYNIELVVHHEDKEAVQLLVSEKLPGKLSPLSLSLSESGMNCVCVAGSTMKSEPVEVEGGVLLPYNLPPDRSGHTNPLTLSLTLSLCECFVSCAVSRQLEIVPFFTVIETDWSLAGRILDYSISQTTLEEVFLNVRFVNPLRTCTARVTSLCLSVCLSVCVTTFSATVCNKAAKKQYQRVQRYTGFILKMAIFVKILRSKVMP